MVTEHKTRRPNLLEGLRVGIVGTIPHRDDWGDEVDLDRTILTFVGQLSSLIMQYGGQVVHGSSPLFTPLLAEQSRCNANVPGTQLKLYASQLFQQERWYPEVWADEGSALLKLTPIIGVSGVEEENTRKESLIAMRMAMAEDIDALVAIGGKQISGGGRNPSVLEELTQARWRSVPCFVVCAFGKLSEPPLLQVYSQGNKLSKDEIELFATPSATLVEMVGPLVLHLVKHRKDFMRERTGSENLTIANAASRNQMLRASSSPEPATATYPMSMMTLSQAHSSDPLPPLRPVSPEVISVPSDKVRMASERFTAVRSAIEEPTQASTEELLKRPDFLG